MFRCRPMTMRGRPGPMYFPAAPARPAVGFNGYNGPFAGEAYRLDLYISEILKMRKIQKVSKWFNVKPLSLLWGIKSTPNFFYHNLKMDDQILTIFVRNISDTTGHQMIVYVPASPSVLFLHYLGKTKQAKYYIFVQCNIIIWLK